LNELLIDYLICNSNEKLLFCGLLGATLEKQDNSLSYPILINLTGEQLAKHYGVGCQVFAEPALLDKQNGTKGVLPEMAARLGVKLPNFGKNVPIKPPPQTTTPR